MLLLENLPLAVAIAGGAYAWYRTDFRTPKFLPLPPRLARRLIVAFGWMLAVGVVVKSIGGLFGDQRVQIANDGQRYAYRSREPALFWGEIVGELIMVGGTGAFLIVLGRKRTTLASRAA